jgi:predicted dehydrogenase
MVEVNGTSGRLLIEDTVGRFTLSHPGEELHQVWEAGYFNDTDRAFHAMFERYLNDMVPAYLAGAQPPVHARAGRRALELAKATIESFETGQRVAVG